MITFTWRRKRDVVRLSYFKNGQIVLLFKVLKAFRVMYLGSCFFSFSCVIFHFMFPNTHCSGVGLISYMYEPLGSYMYERHALYVFISTCSTVFENLTNPTRNLDTAYLQMQTCTCGHVPDVGQRIGRTAQFGAMQV